MNMPVEPVEPDVPNCGAAVAGRCPATQLGMANSTKPSQQQ